MNRAQNKILSCGEIKSEKSQETDWYIDLFKLSDQDLKHITIPQGYDIIFIYKRKNHPPSAERQTKGGKWFYVDYYRKVRINQLKTDLQSPFSLLHCNHKWKKS